jgi:hypothetical protein
VREQLDRLKRRNIAVDAIFLVGAAIDEIEAEARHPPPRAPSQILDGRKALPQPRRGAVFGLSGPTSIDHRFPPKPQRPRETSPLERVSKVEYSGI